MVIDTSAILAILLRESDAEQMTKAIRDSRTRLVPALVLLEASIVLLARHGEPGWRMLDEFRVAAALDIIAFDGPRMLVAREAFRRFGKGRHRANLNFGDCVSYASAISEAMPLLFKGNDFRLTDIEAAI